MRHTARTELFSDAAFHYRPQLESPDVIDTAAQQTSSSLRKVNLTGYLVDETGVEKKGDKSVGVGHQYCGNAGKTANSKVAVMGCSSNGDFASIVDARLYLPKTRYDDPQRCDEAGIAEDEMKFKTKIDLAYEMILHQLEPGTSFDYVGADGFYGNDNNLVRKVDLLGLTYMFDIHSNQTVYLEKPEWVLPERKGNRGPQPKRFTVTEKSVNVSEYIKELDCEEWEEIKVRNTAKGSLKGTL